MKIILNKYSVFLFLFLFTTGFQNVSVAELPSWFLSKHGRQKWAIVPAYARNDTYGHIFKGRFFIYPTEDTGYFTGVGVSVSEELFFSTSVFYEYWRENGDELHFDFYYSDFHDPYYGEGSTTKVEDLRYIKSRKFHVQLEYLFHIESYLYSGAFTRFSYRKETDSKKTEFPMESSLFPGVFLRYDSRSDRFNPVSGEFYEIRSWVELPSFSPLFLEGDMRLFFPVFHNSLVLALRAMVGMTFFDKATYSFRFNLGGPKTLRGFWFNRFRGERYYLSQVELRYMPIPLLTFSGFFDLGSTDDETFSFPPRYSFGGGIAIGLPPHYDKKLRIEYGVGEDQTNFIVSYLHAF